MRDPASGRWGRCSALSGRSPASPLLMLAAYLYVVVAVVVGAFSPWMLLVFLSAPTALSLIRTFRKEVPDAADAMTAKLDTVFGLLFCRRARPRARGPPVIAGAIALACAGWAFTFGLAWGNFWLKIGLTVIAVCATRWPSSGRTSGSRPARWLKGSPRRQSCTVRSSSGNAVAPYVVPGAHAQVGGIYGLGEGSSRIWIFLLLFFVTGPGEEIFWRGFLQDALQKRLRPLTGYLVATAVYGGVHVFSGNLMLTLAALVAGAFWGALYLWRKDLARSSCPTRSGAPSSSPSSRSGEEPAIAIHVITGIRSIACSLRGAWSRPSCC